MKRALHLIALLLPAAFLATSAPVRSQEAPLSLERALVRRSPELIKRFQKKEYQNVGVLKFLVTKDGKKFSDNVGTLNMLLARQLETALIIGNDVRNPIGIVDNASEAAAKISGANHLSAAGRARLFGARYPLAWGKDKVNVDAFVTGIGSVSADLKTLTVSLLCFDRHDGKVEPIGDDIVAALRSNQLADLGESFVLRGLFEGGKVEVGGAVPAAKIAEYAVKTRDQEEKHPLQVEAAPIRLRVFYGNHEIRPEFRDGKAFIPEPREGQKVGLELLSVAKQGRYGVVLKVNGENTIGRERAPDIHCTRWVLAAGEGPYTVDRFQLDDDTALEFRVGSVAESRQREIHYGADVGTITMTVFPEAIKPPKKKFSLEYEKAYEEVVEKVHRPKQPPDNYHALKAQLLEDINRGLILEGRQIKSKVESVPFVPEPHPVMVTTIVYYKPGR